MVEKQKELKKLENNLHRFSRRHFLGLLAGGVGVYAVGDVVLGGPVSSFVRSLYKPPIPPVNDEAKSPVIKSIDIAKNYVRPYLEFTVKIRAEDPYSPNQGIRSITGRMLDPTGATYVFSLSEVSDGYRGSFTTNKVSDHSVEINIIDKEDLPASKTVGVSDFPILRVGNITPEERSAYTNPSLLDRSFELMLADELFGAFDREELIKTVYPYFKDKNILKDASLGAVNYTTFAGNKYGLHTKDTVDLLIRASEADASIVTPTSFEIIDATKNKIAIQSKDKARDMWMIAERLRRKPIIVDHPEMYEAISVEVEQAAFDMFDVTDTFGNYVGPGYYDGKTYSPTDEAVWEVMDAHLDYYLNSALGLVDRKTVFPWHNSILSKNYIVDSINRRIAEMHFWQMNPYTYDKVNKTRVNGIEGMKLFWKEQVAAEYNAIKTALDNPDSDEHKEARWQYNPGWMDDRGQYIPNTVEQFKKIDEALANNWDNWDLIRFIYGDEFYHVREYGGESATYQFGLPLGYKAFGVPYARMIEQPVIVGIMPGEWGVVLPDAVIKTTKETLSAPYNEILEDNLFSLYSALYGVKQEGSIDRILKQIRGNNFYLWVKS